MKKLLFIFSFLICAVMAYGQYPNNQNISNNQTRYHIPVLKTDSSILLPIKDTLNNQSTFYPGALTVRPQDTIGHVFPSIYMSDGRYWHKIVGTPQIIAPGIDSLTIINNTFCIYSGITITCYPLGRYIDNITLNSDSTFYYLLNGGTLLDSVWIPKDPIFGSPTINIRDTGLFVNGVFVIGHIFDANGGGIVFGTAFNFIVSDSLSTPPVLPPEGTIILVGTSPTGQFAGHANEIATRDSAAGIYTFQVAVAGNLLYNATTGFVSQLTSGVWVRIGRALIHQSGEDASYGDVYIGTKANFKTSFLTNNLERMMITPTGNVGIGITPTGGQMLEVLGNVLGNNDIISYGITGTASAFRGPNISSGSGLPFYILANVTPTIVKNTAALTYIPSKSFFSAISDDLGSARGTIPFPVLNGYDQFAMTIAGNDAQKNYGVGIYNWTNKNLFISDSTAFRKVLIENADNNIVIGDTLVGPLTAQLYVKSTTKGVLFAPMNTAQMNAISSPANGLMIYNTDSACYFSYTGSVWKSMCGGSGGGGGSGSSLANFYLKDSALSGDRIVTLSGNRLGFYDDATGNDLLTIDANPANQQVNMAVYNADAGGSNASHSIGVNSSSANFALGAAFDNETNIAYILGNADATTSTLQYNAIGHIFTGTILSLDNGTYKPLSIDPPHDTISLRVVHASGAESLLKIGDDGSPPRVTLGLQDIPNGEFAEYLFQAGGASLSINSTVSTQRTVNYSFNSGGIQTIYASTTTGSTSTLLHGINTGDHPYADISAAGVTSGQTGEVFITDTSININTPLLRINGVLYGGGSSITQLIGQEFTGSTSTTLTLSQNFISGTIEIWKNGVLLNNADFTEAPPNQVTLNVARLSGDMFKINCNY